MTLPEFTTLKLERVDAVALVRLHRPEVLNALNRAMLEEFKALFAQFEADEGLRCVVITGSDKAFAAGADIKELVGATMIDTALGDRFEKWEDLRRTKTPLIAGVSGFALGGGCELAMLCDTIVASDSAQFGQPEIKIGTIPGAGGTQRLTKALGKAKSMELML
ncbi:MAG: enoyl-CoA hydratase-related protein, partial [Candidatus Competibacterales bacterium]